MCAVEESGLAQHVVLSRVLNQVILVVKTGQEKKQSAEHDLI